MWEEKCGRWNEWWGEMGRMGKAEGKMNGRIDVYYYFGGYVIIKPVLLRLVKSLILSSLFHFSRLENNPNKIGIKLEWVLN